MGRKPSRFGSAAQAQTPPASVPQSVGSDFEPVRHLLERRLAEQQALSGFARRALRASALDAVVAEGAALVRRFPALSNALERGADEEEELAFSEAVADVLAATSGRISAVEASHHAALHDPLTGLANRSLIMDHLDLALKRADRRRTLTAVVFLDLDDFKRINDTLGHLAGDELLVSVADRLRGAVRPADTAGRWGGDEFVIVCEDLEEYADVTNIIDRITAAFELPFDVHHMKYSIGASIGVAVSGEIDDPSALIAVADSEMYRDKHRKADQGTPRRDRSGPSAFPACTFPPKQERLTLRLLELVSSVYEPDSLLELPEGGVLESPMW